MAWVKFVREDIEIEVEDGISVLEAEIQASAASLAKKLAA